MRALLAVGYNEMMQLYRDMWYLLILTVGATGILVVMAYTLSTDIKGVATLVVDLDKSNYSRRFIQAVLNDEFFAVDFLPERTEAEQRLQAGRAKAVIIIPAEYQQQLKRGRQVQVQVLIDGSEPGVAELTRTHMTALAGNLSQQLAIDAVKRQGTPQNNGLAFHPRVRYNADLKTIVSVMPGLMSIVLTTAAVGTASAFARERERGSFEQLISTPLGRWPLLLGRILPYLLIGLVDIVIFVAIGHFAFGVPLAGDLGLFAGLSLLYIFATTSTGVLIAQFLHTQHMAMLTTFMFFGITPTYLSDIFFPVTSMPVWLQQQSILMPATHFTVIARGILLKGTGWSVLWPNAQTLLLLGAVMSLLAYLRFRKKLS
jgi:ABC-2 type transport system permease protein